jgi:phosphatidate cytidylyltransferase
MSDERWRRSEEDPETIEFGGPLFPDEPGERGPRDDTGERRLQFGPNDSGPLPSWTDPPTGEVPRLAPPPADDDGDEVDVWSTFTTESPVWRDDDPVTTVMEQVPAEPRPDASGGTDRSGGVRRPPSDRSGGHDRPQDPSGSVDITGGYDSRYGSGARFGPPTGEIPSAGAYGSRDRTGDVAVAPRSQPGRITIGTDPSGTPRRPTEPGRRGRPTQRSGRPAGPARTSAPPPRNMSTATIAGLVMAVVFVAALMIKPILVLIIICVVLAAAGWEFFGKITEKGYRPAVAPGLAACVCAPLAAYWIGERGLPLVVAFAFMAGAIGFIGARGVESGPLPNMAVTTMGVVWIGLLGAYAALILRVSNEPLSLFGLDGAAHHNHAGTDTLFMLALGVAANDIGALVVGSAVGKSPLRAWVSPAKTVEGLLGGALATFLALFIVSKINDDGTWTQFSWILWLSLVIAVLAPLGDLTESMFKRNLDIKDFGTIIQGHGGVLDRFDGFLFALPGVWYLMTVLAN